MFKRYVTRASVALTVVLTWWSGSAAASSEARYSLSVDNRVGKRAFVAAELAAPGGHAAIGARVGYFLTADSLFEVSYLTFEDELTGGVRVDAHQTSVGLKTFFTNSLYVGAGALQQSWQNGDNSKTRSSLSVLVGQQWQWPLVTVGCDWLTYLWPVNGAAPAADAAQRFQLARTYVGVSF